MGRGWECSPPYECYEDWDCFDGEVCVGGSCGLAPALKLPPCGPQNFVTSEWNLSAAPSAFVLADLDGDLDLDLAAGQPASGQIEVALNDGAGTFVLAGAFPVGPPDSALWLVAADFDLDGDVDLAAALPGGGLVLAFGQDAVFMAAPPLAIGSLPEQLIVTDMNGDAAPDLVMLYADNPQVTTWINDGKGGFGPEVSVLIEGPVHSQAAIVDITGDGVPDLLAPFEGNFVGVGLWSGAVDGVFLGQEAFDTPLAVTAVYATHLAPMDARSVIAVRPSESGGVAQVWGPGPEPWLAKPTLYGGSVALRGGVMAEFEGSLGPDLISATAGPTIAVWAGDGAGGFACERKITVPAPTVGTLMAVGDVDGDGQADILLGREDSGTVTLLRRP